MNTFPFRMAGSFRFHKASSLFMNIWLFAHEIRPVYMKMRNYFRILVRIVVDFSEFRKGFRNLRNGFFVQSSCLFTYFFVRTSAVEEGLRHRESGFWKVLKIFRQIRKKVLFTATGVEIFMSLKFYDKCPPFFELPFSY